MFPLPLALIVCWAMIWTVQAASSKPPNILLILADDMGYGDAGFAGSQYLRTPQLDALADSGVVCTQAYVCSPICSPSRAGLLTGRDPRRFGYQANLNQASHAYATRKDLLGLPSGEHTLADHLSHAGYQTALIGKWHLGTSERFHPMERGFDFFCGMLGGSHGYFPQQDRHRILRNRKSVTEFSSPYLTDFFTDEALRWLDRPNVQKTPWFLFMSYNAPHGPLQATEEDLKNVSHILDPKRRTYAAMMFALDRSIGRLVQWLKTHREREQTLIVFLSDNGGATNNASWNGPLSGVKGCLKEGGIRIPMIWSHPGEIPAQSTWHDPISSLDLLPSFMALARQQPLPLRSPLPHEDSRNWKQLNKVYGSFDGLNVIPWFKDGKNGAPIIERTFFWRCQGQAALLNGAWKLIRPSHRPVQLFQPGIDASESSDQLIQRPEQAQKLLNQLAHWESMLPTAPLWSSSPYWQGQSASHYDHYKPREEPR